MVSFRPVGLVCALVFVDLSLIVLVWVVVVFGVPCVLAPVSRIPLREEFVREEEEFGEETGCKGSGERCVFWSLGVRPVSS